MSTHTEAVRMAETLSPALRAFSETLDALVRRHNTDGQTIVTQIHPHFVELIADTSWLDERLLLPADGSGQTAARLLAAAPDESWTIVAVAFPPGATTPVHDHHTWGLVGVVRGSETEERYERLDDGTRPGFARLRHVDTAENRAGAISHIVPPTLEIHRIHNSSEIATCSIHVYGGNLAKMIRNQYDLERNTVEIHQPAYVPVSTSSGGD